MALGDWASVTSVELMFDEYHKWYYESEVWKTTSWLGVPCLKSVQDMWNYQEIVYELQPSIIVEFGVYRGGSALYFASILDQMGVGRILGFDIDLSVVHQIAKDHPRISLFECSSSEPMVAQRIESARTDGPIFAVLDSDHSRAHVLAELETITPILRSGDYVIVEDTNINGHPVRPGWGPGPYEALHEFLDAHPTAYTQDKDRELKFGWTHAPEGFLIRN